MTRLRHSRPAYESRGFTSLRLMRSLFRFTVTSVFILFIIGFHFQRVNINDVKENGRTDTPFSFRCNHDNKSNQKTMDSSVGGKKALKVDDDHDPDNVLPSLSSQQPPVVLFNLTNSGFGSQMINMLVNQFYFETFQKRKFLVDESYYSYRRSKEEGVLTGFFSPTMPVLDQAENFNEFGQIWFPGGTINNTEYADLIGSYSIAGRIITDSPNNKSKLIIRDLFSFGFQVRKDIFRLFPNEDTLYLLLMQYACTSLKFNPKTLHDIKNHKEEHGIPIEWNAVDGHTVGFHIRRSDKILRESRMYTADKYVEKMIYAVGGLKKAQTQISRCFVTSDTNGAVEEMRATLNQYNMTCSLFTMSDLSRRGTTKTLQSRISYDDTITFLSEISLLIDSTFFIGTMNSNVGVFVTLMRSCPAYDRGEKLIDGNLKANHYFASYGVDRDSWMLR